MESSKGVPESYTLLQSYPNPFNLTTTIKYSIPLEGTHHDVFVQLIVYDMLGNEVTTLVNQEQPAGYYEVEFDASKYNLCSGIYFYRLSVDDTYSEIKKMVLLK